MSIRTNIAVLLAWIRGGSLLLCTGLMLAQPAHADNATFAELLAKAKAQAAAGHRWAPQGDNMTETVMRMMDIVPSATHEQLAELSALLESDKALPPEVGTEAARSPGGSPPGSSSTIEGPSSTTAGGSPSGIPNDRPVETPVGNSSAARSGDARSGDARSGDAPSGNARSGDAPSGDAPSGGQSAAIPANPSGSPSGTPPVRPSAAPEAAQPPPGTAALSSPTPAHPPPNVAAPQPGARSAALFARGLDAEHLGNISGARRFYASAAQLGDAAAARNLGRLYDPAYLRQTALGGVDSDPDLARRWYQRAVQLGDTQAGPLLEALSVR